MAINPLSVTSAYQAAARIAGTGQAGTGAGEAVGMNFGEMLKGALADAAQTMHAGEVAAAQGAAGQADIVNVVNAVNAAELTLNTVVAVRDKVIAAYQDILKMPI
jgi:flagellar hook-basal body complex protein FliE